MSYETQKKELLRLIDRMYNDVIDDNYKNLSLICHRIDTISPMMAQAFILETNK